MRGRPARSQRRALSQNFLRSERIAAQLVQAAEIGPSDLVLDIGAGSGIVTQALARKAGRVIAIDADARWAARLRERFQSRPAVQVIESDALEVPFPDRPFKIVSNPPFHITSQLLRRLLDDPAVPMVRAELILAWGAAIGRANVHPPAMASLSWMPWYELIVTRRLPTRLFVPSPQADAAVLSIRRRPQALIPLADRPRYIRLLRRAYRCGRMDAASGRGWAGFAAQQGLPRDARPADLDVWAWAALLETFTP